MLYPRQRAGLWWMAAVLVLAISFGAWVALDRTGPERAPVARAPAVPPAEAVAFEEVATEEVDLRARLRALDEGLREAYPRAESFERARLDAVRDRIALLRLQAEREEIGGEELLESLAVLEAEARELAIRTETPEIDMATR